MTNLPAKMQDAQALIYAREIAHQLREVPMEYFGTEVRVFNSEDSRRVVREMFKWLAYQHVDNLREVAEFARQGWSLADEALRQMWREMTDRGEVSHYLNSYIMDVTAGQIRRLPAQRKESHVLRDVAVASMVASLMDKFGLKATRNPTTQRNRSACSIVAETLGMSEPAVVAIWGRMKKFFVRNVQ